jgi:hypothetical protein
VECYPYAQARRACSHDQYVYLLHRLLPLA